MSEYLVTDTQLTNVANAIRTKGHTNAELVWPSGYISAIDNISSDTVNLQDRIVTPSASNQYISADSEYDGLGTVMVSGSPNLIAGNIKKNVNIFGITGTYEEQNVGVDTSDANATSLDLLENKTAYVNGIKITGGIPSVPAAIYTPTSTTQIIQGGQYLAGSQTIAGDENLISENIAHGVSIFGIEGTYSGDNNSVNVSDTTATRNDVVAGKIFYAANKQRQVGTIPQRTGDDISVNRNVITIPAGFYPVQSLTNMDLGSVSTPYAIKNRLTDNSVSITPYTDVTSGYVNGGEKSGTAITVNAAELVSGTKTITENGISDVTNYASVDVDITLEEDPNLIPGNIKKNVVIYGVTGVLDNNGIDTSDATAAAADIYPGKTAYVDGDLIIGAMPTKATALYTPSTTDQIISAGQYLTGNQIIIGDTNLIPDNIAKGISVFGITGTHQGGVDVSDTTATAADVLPTANFYNSSGVKTTGAMPVWTDITFDDDQVIIPAGYHSDSTSQQIPLGEITTITAEKGTVNNNVMTITPSTEISAGYINSDTYTGEPITVAASELVSGTRAIDTDGVYDVTNYASVNINVVPATGSATTPATTITVNPNISVDNEGIVTATVSGNQNITPTVSPGYVLSGTSGSVSVTGSNTMNLTTQGTQTITPSTTNQTITSGKYLTGDQTIEAVTMSNLSAENIKNGVRVKIGSASDDDSVANILGTYTPTLQNRTVTPTNANQNITAASGYDGLGQVTVQGIVCSNLTAGNIADGVTVKIGTSTDDDSVITVTGTHSGINTSDATATASDILSGKTAYAKGSKITGNIVSRGSGEIALSAYNVNTPYYSIPAGYYSSTITKNIPLTTEDQLSISSSYGKFSYYSDGRVQYRSFNIKTSLKYDTSFSSRYHYGFLDFYSRSSYSSVPSHALGSIRVYPNDVTEGSINVIENGTYNCISYQNAVVNVPHPVLNIPSLSLTDNILTITNPATNGNFVTGYKIYIDNVLNTTVSNTTINLDNLDGLVIGHNSITVKAIGTYFDDSPMSSVVDYEVLAGYTITVTNGPGYENGSFWIVVGNTTYYDTCTVPAGSSATFWGHMGSSGNPVSFYVNNQLVSSGEGAGGDFYLDYTMTVNSNLSITYDDGGNYIDIYITEVGSGYNVSIANNLNTDNFWEDMYCYFEDSNNMINLGYDITPGDVIGTNKTQINFVSYNGAQNQISYTMGGVPATASWSYSDIQTITLTGDMVITTIYCTCLTGDTLVLMADNSEKRIDEIELNDEILSYDWDTMQLVPNKIIFTDKDENKQYKEYEIWTFDDGTIIKTVHRHEFYNVEAKSMKYMDEWKIGEHAYKYDGTTPALISHEIVPEVVNHYKITGEKGTNYFANGLLNGDRYCPKNINLIKKDN